MGFRAAADATVVVHLTFVAFLLAGGFVAWRWPRLVRLHLPAVVVSAGLAAFGWDCPLTDVEKWFRRRAGDPTYPEGFIDHYLVRPLHPAGITPTLRIGLRVVTVAVVASAYLGLLARSRARSRAGTRTPRREDASARQRSYAS